MTPPPARPDGRYALRHVDAAGTVHLWTCVPTSAHWVARWHAQDSGRATEVLRDDGDGWRVVSVWTPAGGGGQPPMDWSYGDDGCLWDDGDLGRPASSAGWDEDDEPEEETSWQYRPVVDHAAL